MKSANDNALSLADQALESMGADCPQGTILKVVRIRETLLQYPEEFRPKEDLARAEAIIEQAQVLGVL